MKDYFYILQRGGEGDTRVLSLLFIYTNLLKYNFLACPNERNDSENPFA